MARTLFVTPDYTSGVTQCRTLRTPNNAEWLGVFSKALLTMLEPHNWEQINDTDLTVEEAVTMVALMLEEFWNTPDCGTACSLPGLDSPPFRLGADGHFEMLDPTTGEWGTPTGEYEVPPVSPREEATAEERRCLAAANAAYVVGLLYEAITDEIVLGGDTLQVAAAMVAALVTAVGGWIAAPVYAIVQLTIALFAGMIELLQVLGADVWTESYSEHLKCVLYGCSTDTADVVTFDLSCIRENLYVGLDLLSPTFFHDAQIFAQVLFLLETVTMDGLNAAGATTAITSSDCDDCDNAWCYEWDFASGEGGWTPVYVGATPLAVFNTDRWSRIFNRSGSNVSETRITRSFAEVPFHITAVAVKCSVSADTGYNWYYSAPLTEMVNDTAIVGETFPGFDVDVTITEGARVDFGVVGDSVIDILVIRFYGDGSNPFGDDNCV